MEQEYQLSGLRNFNQLAKEGGTDAAIVAKTAAQLKSELKAAISQIIAQKLSFTAPAITATIESSGSLFQAQFDYRQNKEWAGTITRTAIDSNGNLDENDSGNWSAVEEMPEPDKGKFGVLEFLEQTTNLTITILLKQIRQILVLYLVYIKMLLSTFIMIVIRQTIDVRTKLEL